MNPTLSARLLTRRSDGFFRAHPPAPWDAVLETPVALQALALVQPVAAPDPSADLGVWEPQVMEKVLPSSSSSPRESPLRLPPWHLRLLPWNHRPRKLRQQAP